MVFKGSEGWHQLNQGNRIFCGTVTKNQSKCSFSSPFLQDISRKRFCYPRLSPWRLSCPNGLDFKRLLPFERESRAERGDSAYSPNVQRHTSARLHLQAGMRKQALNALRSTQSVLNRDSKLIGGGVLRACRGAADAGKRASSLRVRHGSAS